MHTSATMPPPHDQEYELLAPPLPRAGDRRLIYGKLYGSASALLIARLARRHPRPVVVVCEDMNTVMALESELRFYLAGEDLPLLAFPDWETLPYDVFSPHQDIIAQRLETLYRLPDIEQGILLLPMATLMQRICPRDFLQRHSLLLEQGQRLDLEALVRRLEASGYRRVPQVMEHGEFAVRGALLDLFPSGNAQPIRIDLFDDEIESLRLFDPESQRTVAKTRQVKLLPAREFPFTEDDIARFRQAYRHQFEGDPQRSSIYRDISQGMMPGGIEYYLPLFFDRLDTLFDYLPGQTLFITPQGSAEAAGQVWQEIRQRYEQRRHDIERPLLPPERLYLDSSDTLRAINAFPRIELQSFKTDQDAVSGGRARNFNSRRPPSLLFNPRLKEPSAALKQFLAGFEGRILFTAESEGRREVLLQMLRDQDIHPRTVEHWQDFLCGEERLAICVAPLERGLLLDQPPLCVITEQQLFGERVQQRRRRKSAARDADAIVKNLTELTIGAPVVHQDHGVGRYLGLQTLDLEGRQAEYLTLEYAGGDKLYVPVASLHLISRYTGSSPDSAPLHRLGTDQWEKAKRRAARKAHDVAAELLDIYARREAARGVSCRLNEEEYAAFAARFPFEETPDQRSAIEAVIADMQSERPMDRVVCGDVGFGKTEVAMRAAFVAVNDGKQVAVLTPTTLLAQQHFDNFRDRFADWPVNIELISRFRSKKQQAEILAQLTAGKVDILIGTHKLLANDIAFADLGLVIVDEEQRFGVRQKERLKALCTQVNLLTLTATPIPRTLNMSLAGLRDLSIIATPPAQRLAVKTFVSQWDDNLLKEAIEREIKRGGQVYFLHNDVASIERIARELAELVPQATVEIAHGQMRERQLEQVMSDFYHRRFNLLVCTTIIESGIDVPSANTIVINRADKLGLAQLHQLRGRVGRSHHRAYAYLLVPPRKTMTADAIKRLEAIESLEDLGAGFMLATHDLEIRGAGELLGDEQSGQIQEIGFTLYNELLKRAVDALKQGRQPELDRPLDHGAEIDLRVPALIPADYLPDVHTRLTLYKRIASAADAAALDELQVEMIDRFGLLPEPLKTLIRITELKLKANRLGITKIEAGPSGARIRFEEQAAIDPMAIIQLIQGQPQRYQFDGQNTLRLRHAMPEAEDRIQLITELLHWLEQHRLPDA